MLPSATVIGTWAEMVAIQALDDRIKESNLDLGVYVSAGIEQSKLDGTAYALPFMNFNNALYWNKAIFSDAGLDPDTPPQSLDDMLSMAESLTKKSGDRIEHIGVLPSLGLAEMAWRFGGDWYDADSGDVTANIDPNQQACNSNLTWRMPQAASMRSSASREAANGRWCRRQPVLQGKIAIMMDGCWQVEFIAKYAPDLDYGVAPMPAPPDVPEGGTSTPWYESHRDPGRGEERCCRLGADAVPVDGR